MCSLFVLIISFIFIEINNKAYVELSCETWTWNSISAYNHLYYIPLLISFKWYFTALKNIYVYEDDKHKNCELVLIFFFSKI